MTDREKVIKGLECCTTPGNCGTCPWYPSEDAEEGCIRTLMKAMLALLKAHEPKPVHVTAEINHRKIGECPTCGKPINSGDYPNYCGQCGRAVKWE